MALAQITQQQAKEKKPSLLERAFKGLDVASTALSVGGKIADLKGANPLENYSLSLPKKEPFNLGNYASRFK